MGIGQFDRDNPSANPANPTNPANPEQESEESEFDRSELAETAECSGLNETPTPNQPGEVDQQGPPPKDERTNVCDFFDALSVKLGVPTSQRTSNANGSTPNGQMRRTRPDREPHWVTGICDHCDDRSGPPLIDKQTGRCTKCWSVQDAPS